jgi:hypothetical protein
MILPKTKKEALLLGLLEYYEKPCIRGHTSPRIVKTGQCKECMRENSRRRWREMSPEAKEKRLQEKRDYKQNNKEKVQNEYLVRTYGITLAIKHRIAELQNYQCAGCLLSFDKEHLRDAFIDHCHKTDEIRGLLCHNCNVALGHARDNIEILTRLINYLQLAATQEG